MAAESKSCSNNSSKGKKRRQRYLPHNKPVKKGSYPLRPGVEGFFITCDGGRERQAANEAINLLDSFFEELVDGDLAQKRSMPSKPLNKITKFSDSDSSNSEDESPQDKEQVAECENQADENEEKNEVDETKETDEAEETEGKDKANDKEDKDEAYETRDPSAKRQRIEKNEETSKNLHSGLSEEKPIDKLIEAELEELGDRNKRLFVSLDSGCNGCIFIQMHKRASEIGPSEIVQHMMKVAASTRKHMSRFILRVLPVEVTCYASEEEITRAIKPLIEQHFPTDAATQQKFAVLYEARANTGIDRMKIINAVAKSVPLPHKVDLSNPDKTIIVQIAKTICSLGVAEKYKELSKFNLRQLTSPKQ